MAEYGFGLIGAGSAVVGLFFTAISIRAETHTRRIGNLISLTESHRDIWKVFIQEPRLARILNPYADLGVLPVSAVEERFVLLLVLHLHATYRALEDKLLPRLDGIRQDVGWLFSLPIPSAVWERYKALQDADFVRFVEDCRISK